jgi:hypothetical protein
LVEAVDNQIGRVLTSLHSNQLEADTTLCRSQRNVRS